MEAMNFSLFLLLFFLTERCMEYNLPLNYCTYLHNSWPGLIPTDWLLPYRKAKLPKL